MSEKGQRMDLTNMRVNGYVATIVLERPEDIESVESSQYRRFLDRNKHTVRAWVRTIHTDTCRKATKYTPGRGDIEDAQNHGLNEPWYTSGHNPAWSVLRGCKFCGTDKKEN